MSRAGVYSSVRPGRDPLVQAGITGLTRTAGTEGGERPVSDLLVCAPLGLEARALRRGGAGGAGGSAAAPAAGPLRVRRTGYGPDRAARAARELSGAGFGALAVAGTGGGLAPDLVPGDLVVGAEVTGPAGTHRCPSAPLLAGELRRAGLTARAGRIATVEHLVHEIGRAHV